MYPRGYDMLLPYLEADAALRENFCRNLDLIFYSGAALPQPLWERLEAVAVQVRGTPIPMVSSWGSTETAPMVSCVHFPISRAGNIGLPAPGNQVKMVPSGDKFELRVNGPCVTPGYWRQPAMTAQAFDAEGFYQHGGCGAAGRSGAARDAASSSTAASPRISSCRREPGCTSAHCVWP